ncbi:Hypothetical predicted protein [Mytilus galloprovincialis]|uniref:Profilin n=1 Tax=Mytilus galloprovincialis TaxID=29158 RepID=A0A8B6BX99_MYTGA|nr:Hypothetical predicted protein [Mytilus galloprovincialis]
MTTASWDEYIDDLIARSNLGCGNSHIDKACIISIENGERWNTDSHSKALKLSQAEATNIAKCFASKNFSQFIESGVVAEGCKYVFLKEDDKKIVYTIKKGHGRLTLGSSKTAIVIAHSLSEDEHLGILGRADQAVLTITRHMESLNV